MNATTADSESGSFREGLSVRASFRIRTMAILLAATCIDSLAWAADAPIGWSYSGDRGPDRWASLTQAFEMCGKGQLQSPIDVSDAALDAYVPLAFHYRSQNLEAYNDGRTVSLVAQPGNELRIRGEAYRLIEMHFHVPGEHRLIGERAAAELHLVHQDAQGRLLMVAIPVVAGARSNTTLSRIVERLPLHPGERFYYRQVGINPLFVLPTGRSYYTYSGSLAEPPCSEPVSWILMAQPVELEPPVLERLAAVTGENARPVQSLNNRPVYLHLQHP
jgi:carbonic anhydrase